MPEEKLSKKNFMILGVILIILVLSVSAAGIILLSPNAGKPEKPSPYTTLKVTDSFSNITVEEAYNLINNTPNVNIIDDPTGCHCRFDRVHIGNPPKFEAILITNLNALPNSTKSLYNTTNITIFYDDNGMGDSILHCQQLVNHSYGAIYYLEGGLEAWQAKNYPVVT